MSLFRCLKNSAFHFRKEAISTTAIFKFSENEVSNKLQVDPKDRSKVIDVETSIRYMKSKAYQEAYGTNLVWELYRRNFKGQLPPETRKTCIRKNKISTGSPCPICRDEYLVVDYRNVDLLKQFISPVGGIILPTKKTGICQKQYEKIVVAIKKASNYGLITFEVPHRIYDYSLYNKA